MDYSHKKKNGRYVTSSWTRGRVRVELEVEFESKSNSKLNSSSNSNSNLMFRDSQKNQMLHKFILLMYLTGTRNIELEFEFRVGIRVGLFVTHSSVPKNIFKNSIYNKSHTPIHYKSRWR